MSTAMALKNHLETEGLLNDQPVRHDHFLVSDYTKSFEAAAQMFFHQSVELEKHSLWN